MIPLRVVLDTNVLVSAGLRPGGLQDMALHLALTKPARLYISKDILAEYSEVLSRRELRIGKGPRRRLLEQVTKSSFLVAPTKHLDAAFDVADNIFLECADAARADYLVTGNLRDFPRFWKRTKIITAREFLFIVAPHMLD